LTGPLAKLYERSLFERMEEAGYPVHMLRTQYRMHPDISHFPSQHFYQNRLLNAASVQDPSHTASFHEDER
jgi:superfamily I DNA and/or RNA helicase